MKTDADRITDCIINHVLLAYDYVSWGRFISQLKYCGLIRYIEQSLWDMDCSRITKNGFQVISIKSYEYEFIVNNILRSLDRVDNPALYNYYFERLLNLHCDNIVSDERYTAWHEEQDRIEADKKRVKEARRKEREEKTKRKKMKDEYVRSESTDLFDGHPKYIYSNLKTGDEIISDNPNLLDELNKPKTRKKKDAAVLPKVVSLPIGFSFNVDKIKKKTP